MAEEDGTKKPDATPGGGEDKGEQVQTVNDQQVQTPPDPLAAALGDLNNLMAATNAEISALRARVDALTSQQQVLSSTAAEDGAGEGEPAAKEKEEEYPTIDLESLQRTIGDY